MTVYCLFQGSYSDRTLLGVFASQEDADAVKAEIEANENDYSEEIQIEVHEVGELIGWKMLPRWTASVSKSDGTIQTNFYQYHRLMHPTKCEINDWEYEIVVHSPISEEHAMKVAAEKWQEWLRTQGITRA